MFMGGNEHKLTFRNHTKSKFYTLLFKFLTFPPRLPAIQLDLNQRGSPNRWQHLKVVNFNMNKAINIHSLLFDLGGFSRTDVHYFTRQIMNLEKYDCSYDSMYETYLEC